MKNDNSLASILKNYFEGMGNIEKEEKENELLEPSFDLYQNSSYIYGLVKEQGSKKVLEDFLNKIIATYGLEDEASLFASTLIDACSKREQDWRAVDNLIHCILNYIDEDTEEDEDYAVEEDEWDTDEDEEKGCCGNCVNHCDECECECENCCCGNNYEPIAESKNIQTVTFTTKSGQVLGCCTDEDITSIKVVSSNGKMSIFNL